MIFLRIALKLVMQYGTTGTERVKDLTVSIMTIKCEYNVLLISDVEFVINNMHFYIKLSDDESPNMTINFYIKILKDKIYISFISNVFRHKQK